MTITVPLFFTCVALATFVSVTVAVVADARLTRAVFRLGVGWVTATVGLQASAISAELWLVAMTATTATALHAFFRQPKAPGARPWIGAHQLSNSQLRAIAQEARRQSQQGDFL